MITNEESNETGILGKLSYWIEYPFTATKFPWEWVAIFGLLIVILIFFMRDGNSIIAEHIAEVIPQ